MNLTRREFVLSSAAVVAGAVVARTANAELQSMRSDPLDYRLSLAAYSLRKYLPQDGKPGEWGLDTALELAQAWNFDAVEPTSYYFTSEEAAYVHSLKRKAARLGLGISGTAIRNDFCHPDAEQRAREVAHVKKWVDIAAQLGAPHIRVFAGNEHTGQSDDAARALVVEGLKPCADYAGEHGVTLGLENHGYLTGSADDLDAILSQVPHEWLGINLDTGNFKADPYGNIEKATARAVNVQFKTDLVTPDGKGREPADFGRILYSLYTGGYKGFCALEYEGKEEPLQGIPKFLADVRAGMKSAAEQAAKLNAARAANPQRIRDHF